LAQHVSSAGRHDRLALRHDHVCRRHSWEVTLFGCGAHRSMPQKSINPVVMAASAVMHLQGVVSREVAMTDAAVVTVSTLRAGMTESVIPDQALLRQNVRTFKDQVRQRVLAAIRRIPEAEATASAAPKPPEFSVLSEYPVTSNDKPATRAGSARIAYGDRGRCRKRGLPNFRCGIRRTERYLVCRRRRLVVRFRQKHPKRSGELAHKING
jgi:metal-dependent amidase/aminoacylase/carboxypeptidase family protein